MKKHHEILLQLFKVLEGFKPQKRELYEHLENIIEATYYPDDKILYEQDDVIKEIFFLASGTAISYTFTAKGERLLLHIYRQNDFIAGQSFTQQTKSPYYLMACAGAYMLHMTHNQLHETYANYPDAQELARFRLSAAEAKELRHKQTLILPGSEMVEAFYNDYPELLEPGKVLRDRDVASYLLLAESTLRGLRNELFRLGKLKNPSKNYE